MIRQTMRQVAAALAAIPLMAIGGAALAVPFQTGFTTGGNWNFLYAQGFSPSVRANPDPFTDPMLGLEDTVNLSRFRFFKSGYEVEEGVPLVATEFQLAIVDNFFLDLSTFTTSSPQLVGLSTNTIATTASYATNDPIDFQFDDLELSYGAIDYAAIFVKDDGVGNLSIVGVPVNIVNYVETEPGSEVFVPEVDYGNPSADWVYSASNFANGNFLATFHPPYADAVFVAFFNEEAVSLPGDYNGDNVVDAADYTVWRNNLGTNFDLNGNGDESGNSMGVVDAADYIWWKNNYGDAAMGGGGLAGEVVPEPSAMALVLSAGGAIVLGARGRRGRNAGVRRA